MNGKRISNEVCGASLELRHKVESLLRAYEEAGSFLLNPAMAQPATGDYVPEAGVSERPTKVGPDTTDHRPGDTSAEQGEGPGTQIGPYSCVEARRGRHGDRLPGRTAEADPPASRAQDHQIGHGLGSCHRPLRGRAPGADDDGPPEHRQGVRRRHRGRETGETGRQGDKEKSHCAAACLFRSTSSPGLPALLVFGREAPTSSWSWSGACRSRASATRAGWRSGNAWSCSCWCARRCSTPHQKGVIHRDIKPSNVLVADQDGKPAPKGDRLRLAKAIEQPLTEHAAWPRRSAASWARWNT